MRVNGRTSVMASRHEPPDSLDYFPTPPWATRAFVLNVLPFVTDELPETAFDPACGEGHMAAVLAEYCRQVHASDIFPYGFGEVADFLDDGEKPSVDWIITNPPFNKAVEFTERALTHPAARARVGVAMLCRTVWLEGEIERFPMFERHPPALVAQFAERVPMVKGRWDPKAKSATAYAWFVWRADRPTAMGDTRVRWIPPGRKRALTKPTDFQRFAARTPAPLLEGECQ